MIKSLLKKAALLLALQSLFFLQTFGQAQNYNSWEIDGAFLSGCNSSVVSLPNRRTTRIKFRVTVAKNIAPMNFNFQLIRRPNGQTDCGCAGASCACSAISTVYGIRDSDFPAGQNTVTKEYELDLYVENGASTHDATIRDGDVIMLAIATDSDQNPTSPPFNPAKKYTAQIQLPPTTPPGVPRNLKVDASSACSIALSWTRPSSCTQIESYAIYVNGKSTLAWSNFGTGTSYTLTDLPPNTTYAIFVTAYNGIGESMVSNTVNVTTSSPVSGTTLNNAIEVRLENSNLLHYFFPDNSPENCYRNDFVGNASNEFNGQPSDDIYYKVISSYYGTLQISTCGSPNQEDTRIHVLDANGKWMRHVVEAYPTVCASYNTSRTLDVRPGVYYVVVERAGYGRGQINLKMSLNPMNVPGITWTLPIHLGTLNDCERFSDYLPDINASFRDQYGWTGDDVFYRFRLTKPTNIRIGNCNDAHPDFGVYLFDSVYQFIAKGDVDNCLLTSRVLPAGEYTVMFEGEADSYPFSYGMAVSIETQDCNQSQISSDTRLSEMPQRYQQSKSEESWISIYPIPTNDVITIDVAATSVYSVSMTDLYGIPVKTWTTLQGKSSLDVSQVREGVYMVQVRAGNQTTVRRVEVKR